MTRDPLEHYALPAAALVTPSPPKPGPHRNHRKNRPTAVALAVRRRKAWDLRVAGASYRQISEQLGVCEDIVWNDVQRVYAEFRRDNSESVEHWRAQGVERLERAIQQVMHRVAKGELEAIDRLVKVETLLAGLRGIPLPKAGVEITQVQVNIDQASARHELGRVLALHDPEVEQVLRDAGYVRVIPEAALPASAQVSLDTSEST